MGAKYTTLATSGYNSSPPPDDGTQTAANLITWDKHKTKLSDPVKTLADAMNTALVSAFDYSVRQISASDSTVAGDHMRCVEIAPTVSAAVTVSLGDAATMTNAYRLFIKNSSTIAQTIGRVTVGDKIDNVAANISIGSGEGIVLQVTTGATGYVTIARTGLPLTGGTVSGNLAITGTLAVTGTSTLAAVNASNDLTVARANVGGNSTSRVDNTDNTNGASHARFAAVSGGASSGDALNIWSNGVIDWTLGLDNSDSDALVGARSAALGTSNWIRVGATLDVAFLGSLAWGTGTATFGQVVKRKTADESVTNAGTGTTLQNDDHLSFSIAANEEWTASFYLNVGDAVNVTGIKVTVTSPAGSTIDQRSTGNGNSTENFASQNQTSGNVMSFAAGATWTISTSAVIRIDYWVLNAGTAGTIQLQWAQETASATALKVKKGSYMVANRVA